MDIVGLDVGYGFVKAVSATGMAMFPTLVGTADRSQFGVGENDQDLFIQTVDGREFAIGETAIRFSRMVTRLESRNWIQSREWLLLAQAALIKINTSGPVTLVVGLPLSYYSDKQQVVERLMGTHYIVSSNGGGQRRTHVEVRRVIVVPQPFGSLFKQVFLPNGRIHAEWISLLEKSVGIIDFGSNHTNFLEVNEGKEIEAGSTAINMGGWDLTRAVKEYLLREAPGVEMGDHTLMAAIQRGWLECYGEQMQLEPIVKPERMSLIDQVCATASQMWGDGGTLWAILVTGGLAEVVGPSVRQFFSRHKRVIIIENGQMANARGFYAYGRFLKEQQSRKG